MLKKVTLYLFCIYFVFIMIACDSKEDSNYSDYEDDVYTEENINSNEEEMVENIINDVEEKEENIDTDIEESSLNESINYSYVDIVFNDMDRWNEYEGNQLYTVSFFTHAPTGDLVFSTNYIDTDSRMAIQRNYIFENGSMIYDEEGNTVRGGILYENYQVWDNSIDDNEKYEQLKSIYAGHISKKESK